MPSSDPVATHYGRNSVIVEAFVGALASAGVPRSEIVPEHLAGGDEFHLGGAAASDVICDGLGLTADVEVIDLGCGVGGLARRIASRFGADVTGVDLTPQFVQAATELSSLVGLGERTRFEVGSVVDLPVEDGSFGVATMFHVGMNIDDKEALMAEVARVVRPGGRFVVYDIMRIADGELTYPMPWATDPATSFVSSPDAYLRALEAAGFTASEPRSHAALVADALAGAAASPPKVTLVHLMGAEFPSMISNLGAALRSGVLAPIEIVAHR